VWSSVAEADQNDAVQPFGEHQLDNLVDVVRQPDVIVVVCRPLTYTAQAGRASAAESCDGTGLRRRLTEPTEALRKD
jgi:hypothetical protein